MTNTITKEKTKDLVLQFVMLTQSKDYKSLQNLLAEDGQFNIQDEEGETLDADKKQFMNWFIEKLENTTIENVEYDQCVDCIVGSPVVLFNKGKFPVTNVNLSERSKTGISISQKDGLITILKFCYVFLKTKNDYLIDIKIGRTSTYD